MGVLIGTVAMIFAIRFDYRKLASKKVGIFAVILSVVLLALVFVPGISRTNYGATRWIGIGAFTLQPSEIAKYGLVVFASGYASKNMDKMRTFSGSLPVLCVGGILCLLIMLEPNMSVTVCLGTIMLAMIFLSGMKLKYFLIIGLPLLALVPVLIIVEPYRLLRLSAFLDPWASPKEEGYQLIQSLYALGNGNWFGTGLFRSRQKYRFLPFAESDFILAIIGEELGFFGIVVLFGLFFLLTVKGIKVASKAKDAFSYLLASGITLIYGVQTVLNALVVSGTIPPTGIPLPLISAGNTSLVVTMAGMGILQRIALETKADKNSYNKT